MVNTCALIYSGGLDSTTLLYHLREQGTDVHCLGINYGQRHRKELDAARSICDALHVEFTIADLSGIRHLIAGSSQTSDDIAVPEGHYASETMKLTVVPNRNMIMLSVALGWAISRNWEAVAYAAHAGDHTIYPDCRPEFADAMNRAASLADWHEVKLIRPFIDLSKGDIAKRAVELGVPVGQTWSCYKGGNIHCGLCGTCVERREAFELAGVSDPTPYEAEYSPA